MDLLNVIAKKIIEMKINGKSFFGRNIIVNGNISIDGVVVAENTPVIKLEILGECESVSTMSGDVVVHGAAKTINTKSGDVDCHSVFGNVSTMSGDVTCSDITGSVSTMSGDVHCKSKG